MEASAHRLSGIGIWCSGLRRGDPAEIVDAAAELEDLGFTALWIGDIGGDLFEAVERLLGATRTITVATGILNLWRHSAEETAAEHARLTEIYGDRFLVGIGISHAPIIDTEGPGTYAKPLATTINYLDALDAAPIPLSPASRVLGSLGPKMLQLAAARTAGVHPYAVTPEHTAISRAAVGPTRLVLPEQTVALAPNAETGRLLARQFLGGYLGLPNYVNNWRRLGFGEADLAEGGSDRLVDALVAWGDESAIAARIKSHFDAGADHVCIQALGDEGLLPRRSWRRLAAALTG